MFGEDVRLIEKDNILTDYRVIKANSKEAFLINNCIDIKWWMYLKGKRTQMD